MSEQKNKKRTSHDFNAGVWYAIQELVTEWNRPDLARDIAVKANIFREEAYYLQRRSGFLDDIMKSFIKDYLP